MVVVVAAWGVVVIDGEEFVILAEVVGQPTEELVQRRHFSSDS